MLTSFNWILRTHKNLLSRTLYRELQYQAGAYVSPYTKFAGKPCFPHGMHGVFISGEARIGKDAVIFQGVTIGNNSLGDSKQGAPMIGNYCYIGAGATIVGSVNIGDHVRIGANATVYEDVPDNAVVVGAQQRIIRKEEPLDNRFRTRKKGVWHVWENGQYRVE